MAPWMTRMTKPGETLMLSLKYGAPVAPLGKSGQNPALEIYAHSENEHRFALLVNQEGKGQTKSGNPTLQN